MICKYCGEQLDNNAEYCSFCGKKVIHVPPVFTMTNIGTDIATEAIRDYSEWGFYNNPDAELDPETGKKPDYGYDALDALPDENPLKWARDFLEAEAREEMGADSPEPAPQEAENSESEYPEEEPVEEMPAKERKKVPAAVIVIALVIVAAAIAAGAYLLFGGDKTYEVDLNSIMNEPKVIGYDGFGEMALMPQIDDAKADKWLNTVEFDNDKEAFTEVLETVTYTPDKTKDLSNGDVVNITIDYDKNLAAEKELKVKAQPTTFEVSGLEIGKDLAYDPNAYHAYYDDFILPQSDTEELSRADVVYSTNGDADVVQQAINEIYARHGWIFANEHYNKLFRGFEWYTPMYTPEQFDDSWLNNYEKANLSLLIGYRDELKAAAAKAAEEKAAKEEAEKAAKEEEEKDTGDETD